MSHLCFLKKEGYFRHTSHSCLGANNLIMPYVHQADNITKYILIPRLIYKSCKIVIVLYTKGSEEIGNIDKQHSNCQGQFVQIY